MISSKEKIGKENDKLERKSANKQIQDKGRFGLKCMKE